MFIFSDSFFEFIPVFVGSIFAAIGFFGFGRFLGMRRKAKRVSGKVEVIEKYVSRYRSSDGVSSTLMYRPVVSYVYEGRSYEVRGVSTNQLRHRLGQTLEVLVETNVQTGEIRAQINDSMNIVIFVVFFLIGVSGIVLGSVLETATLLRTVITVAVVFMAGFMIDRTIGKTGSVLRQVKEMDGASSEDVTRITTPKELEKEIVQHQKIGFIIAFLAIGGGVWVMYAGLSQLSASEYDLLFSVPFDVLEKSRNEKPLLIAGIGVFFALTGIYSLIYQSRHYAFLRKR